MVDQAQITECEVAQAKNSRSSYNQPPRGELPPQAVARSAVAFFHDVASLAELQEQLLIVDAKEGVQKLVVPAVLLGVGLGFALGSVPIFLAAFAATLVATTSLSWAASLWIALALGVVLTLILSIPAAVSLKGSMNMFDRSYAEWRRNMEWLKETLRRVRSSPA
jgi:hypothetical protein